MWNNVKGEVRQIHSNTYMTRLVNWCDLSASNVASPNHWQCLLTGILVAMLLTIVVVYYVFIRVRACGFTLILCLHHSNLSWNLMWGYYVCVTMCALLCVRLITNRYRGMKSLFIRSQNSSTNYEIKKPN